MRKTWMLVLLISLGLNFGLGFRLWQDRTRGSQESLQVTRPCGPDRMGHGRPDSLWQKNLGARRLRHLTDALDLRPDQALALEKIQQQRVDWIRQRGQGMADLRGRVRSLLLAPEPDPAQVRSLIHDMGRQQAELDSLVTETIMAELETLDPPQRETYLRMLPLERRRFGESARKSRRGSGPGAWGGRRQ